MNNQEVQVKGANYHGQDLRGRNFLGMDLRGADFGGANLSGANLEGAILLNVFNVSIDEISKVKTLYNAELDEDLRKQLEENYQRKYRELIKDPNKYY